MTAFVGKNLFDGIREIKDFILIIEDSKIIQVGSVGEIEIPSKSKVVNIGDKTIIPGLIDCHLHVFMDPHRTYKEYMLQPTGSYMEFGCIATNNLKNLIMNGITFARDMGAKGLMAYELQKLLKEKVVIGPDLKVCGESLSITGGHGYWMSKNCDGAHEYAKAVRQSILEGCDHIKLMVTGGVSTPGKEKAPCEMEYEEIETAVREAHKKARKVAVHTHGYSGIKFCINAGVDSIEHGVYLDEKLLIRMIEKDIYFVPTLSAPHYAVKNGLERDPHNVDHLESARIIEQHNQIVKRGYELGVKIAMGTDKGIPGNLFEEPLSEIILLSKLGISNIDVLKMSTSNGAELLGIYKTHGTLEKDKTADFIILDKNPLENIDNIHSNKTVFKNGIQYN